MSGREKYCKECGEKILASDRFCTKCGKSIERSAAAQPPGQPGISRLPHRRPTHHRDR